jgi:hypothetical protein
MDSVSSTTVQPAENVKTLLVVAKARGPSFGEINAFNMDFCVARSAGSSRVRHKSSA